MGGGQKKERVSSCQFIQQQRPTCIRCSKEFQQLYSFENRKHAAANRRRGAASAAVLPHQPPAAAVPLACRCCCPPSHSSTRRRSCVFPRCCLERCIPPPLLGCSCRRPTCFATPNAQTSAQGAALQPAVPNATPTRTAVHMPRHGPVCSCLGAWAMLLTRGQGLLELLSLVRVRHAKRVQVLGAPDLELGHAASLLDLD